MDEAGRVLTKLDVVVTWAGITFKPKKSRSMIIRKGKFTEKCNLLIQGQALPSIKDNPIK